MGRVEWISLNIKYAESLFEMFLRETQRETQRQNLTERLAGRQTNRQGEIDIGRLRAIEKD